MPPRTLLHFPRPRSGTFFSQLMIRIAPHRRPPLPWTIPADVRDDIRGTDLDKGTNSDASVLGSSRGEYGSVSPTVLGSDRMLFSLEEVS